MTNDGLYSIVLAAGSSERFGSPKQLADIDGVPMVATAMRRASQVSTGRAILVVGAAWRPVLAACLPLDGFIVLNQRHADGIAGSLAGGLRACASVASAVLVMLADQPLISNAHLDDLAATWLASPSKIVATRYGDVTGVPAVFPASYFPMLLQLKGDRGAREVIRDNASDVVSVEFSDAAFDVDTPADLDRITD